MGFDIHENLRDRDDGIDWERAGAYVDSLMNLLAESPEGRQILDEEGDLGWAAQTLRMALQYVGVTPPQTSAADLWEVLSEWIPRKVATPASEAPSIIRHTRVLWQFLDREFGLPNASSCLGILDDTSIVRLEKAMGDPANFGPGKTFAMSAQGAGFDLSTEGGLAKAMLAYNSGLIPEPAGPTGPPAGAPVPPPFPAPFASGGRPAKPNRPKKKAKRRAAKISRKKNRRKR